MYEVSVEREFCAAHALRLNGQMETVHGHNWRVTVTVAGSELDSDGLLVDFHQLETSIDAVIATFHNRDLNRIAPFDRKNPSAENVAAHLAQVIGASLPVDRHVHVAAVSVTEAPNCRATYRPAAVPGGMP